ncbi:hypothetical protein MASR1M8_15840 [Thermomonas brevis]
MAQRNSMEGWAALGQMIGGIGRERPMSNENLQRIGIHGDNAWKMARAQRAEGINAAVGQITSDLMQRALGGDQEALGTLGALTMQGNENPTLSDFTGGLGHLQQYGLRQRAEAELAPTLGAGQAALAALGGKPLKVNQVQGGYQLNPYDASGAVNPTDLQAARTATEAAKAGSYRALGDVRSVQAAAGGWKPGGGGRSASAAKAIIAALEGDMRRKLTPQEVETVYAGGDFDFRAPDPLPRGPTSQMRWVDPTGETMVPLGATPAAGMPAPAKKPVPVPAAGEPLRIASKAAFDKLPSGTRFVAPDGTIRVKP